MPRYIACERALSPCDRTTVDTAFRDRGLILQSPSSCSDTTYGFFSPLLSCAAATPTARLIFGCGPAPTGHNVRITHDEVHGAGGRGPTRWLPEGRGVLRVYGWC